MKMKGLRSKKFIRLTSSCRSSVGRLGSRRKQAGTAVVGLGSRRCIAGIADKLPCSEHQDTRLQAVPELHHLVHPKTSQNRD